VVLAQAVISSPLFAADQKCAFAGLSSIATHVWPLTNLQIRRPRVWCRHQRNQPG